MPKAPGNDARRPRNHLEEGLQIVWVKRGPPAITEQEHTAHNLSSALRMVTIKQRTTKPLLTATDGGCTTEFATSIGIAIADMNYTCIAKYGLKLDGIEKSSLAAEVSGLEFLVRAAEEVDVTQGCTLICSSVKRASGFGISIPARRSQSW